MHEEREAYSVTEGVAVATTELGRISLSTEIAVPVRSIVVYTTPRLNWSQFNDGLGADTEGGSGAIAFGVRTAPGADWNGEISLGFAGLGQDDFKAATIRGQASKNF